MPQECKYLHILNGPNLNLLGRREVELYGRTTLQEIEAQCRGLIVDLPVTIIFRQTNHEGELITWAQEAEEKANILIVNAAAFAHTSLALYDALRLLTIPVIEVHLTQTLAREEYRQHSYVSAAATGVIAGFGSNSYKLAVEASLMLMQIH